jgi:hypothetical protein
VPEVSNEQLTGGVRGLQADLVDSRVQIKERGAAMTRILASVVFALALTGISEPKINGVQPEKLTVSAKPQQITVSGLDFLEGLTLVVTTPGGQPRIFQAPTSWAAALRCSESQSRLMRRDRTSWSS